MSKILLAVDGSNPSLNAEEFLSDAYEPDKDSIVVVSIAELPDFITDYVGEDSGDTQGIQDEFERKAREHVEDAEGRLNAEGFEVTSVVRTGHPGEEICHVAMEQNVDCIIVGKRGQGSVSDPLVGSVSQYLLRNARCPVNVVPH